MKKRLSLIILCMSICAIYIYFLWISHEWQSTQLFYNGSIKKDNHIFLTNNFSGTRNNTWDYITYHSLAFLEKEKEILSANLIQQHTWWNNYFTLTNYLIIQSTGNNRLHIFTDEILANYNNKKQPLSDEGLDYHITYQKWLLSDNIYLTWTYINQLKEKNTFEITIQSYCGLAQYRKTKYNCDIAWNILFVLPITTTTIQRTLEWTLTQRFK